MCVSAYGKVFTSAITKMNQKWQQNKVIFDEEDEDNLFRSFWDNYNLKIISVELNENQTTKALTEK